MLGVAIPTVLIWRFLPNPESELRVLTRQCLQRRIDQRQTVAADAGIRLENLYPKPIEC